MSAEKPQRGIDDLDQQILALLEENGRATYVQIADRIGLSQTPCAERIKRLERDGYIEGYSARLNPDLIGRGFTVFIQVTFTDTSNETFERFSQTLSDIDEVVECHMIAGGYDCLLKVCVESMDAFRTALTNKISTIPGISQTNSYAVIDVVKRSSRLL